MLANQDLGTNMLNWLAEDENLISVQPRSRVDSEFTLGRSALTFIGLWFLLVLPAALLLTGGMVWWRRRQA